MMLKTVSMITICVALSGCGSDSRDFRGLDVGEDVSSRVGTSVRFLSACPTNHKQANQIVRLTVKEGTGSNDRIQESLDGGAALAGLVADFAVNLIGATLEQQKTAQNGSFFAAGVYEGREQLRQENATLQDGDGCVVVYRGAIGPFKQGNSSGKLSQDAMKALGFADTPAFYAEFLVNDTSDYRVLSLNHLIYGDTSARARRPGLKSVVLALTMGLTSTPKDGEEVDDANLAVFRFHLGRLKIGSFYGADDNVRSAIRKPEPGNSSKFVLEGTNMIALVHETAEPSLAIEALAAAFADNKDEIAKAITVKLE